MSLVGEGGCSQKNCISCWHMVCGFGLGLLPPFQIPKLNATKGPKMVLSSGHALHLREGWAALSAKDPSGPHPPNETLSDPAWSNENLSRRPSRWLFPEACLPYRAPPACGTHSAPVCNQTSLSASAWWDRPGMTHPELFSVWSMGWAVPICIFLLWLGARKILNGAQKHAPTQSSLQTVKPQWPLSPPPHLAQS